MTVRGVQFVSDVSGRKTAVLIDLRKHAAAWEDFYDALVVASRRHEPRVPWARVKSRLGARSARRA